MESKQKINFNIKLPNDIINLNYIFKDNGFDLYLVGGAVRDSIIGLKPKDYDLVTDATPDQVIELLKNRNIVSNILETGKAFGVVNVFTTDNNEYEIATMREDIGSDGRKPNSVRFTTIEGDVKRRDLTINAIFYDIDMKHIVDLVGGVNDLKNNIIRTVGDPKLRFKEDRLRILRVIRFASRFNATIDKAIIEAILDDNDLTGISMERIRDEFLKGLKTAKSIYGFLSLLYEFGLISHNDKDFIFGDLKVGNFVEERNYIILLACLLNGNDIDSLNNILNELRYTKKEITNIIFLCRLLELNNDNLYRIKKIHNKTNLTDGDIIRFSELNKLDMLFIKKFLDFKLTVCGNDINMLGLTGKEVGSKIEEMEINKFLLK